MGFINTKLLEAKISYVRLIVSEVEGETEIIQVDENDKEKLERNLKFRHVNMMAIAGAIGTGLIIGSGTALRRGGPGSIFIGYLFTGSLLLVVMMCLAEMATFSPMQRSFSGYCARYVDPALGFAAGWNYFFKYAIVLPTNLTATGLIVHYWKPDLNVAILVSVFLVAIMFVNWFNVKFFGELEFWSAAVKLVALVVCFITCLVITCGGAHEKAIGFRYWNQNAFVEYLATGPTGRFLGFWACVVQSCFSYVGSEAIGVVFGESPNPRKSIPKASRQVVFRIGFFYIFGVFILGLAVSYDNPLLVSGGSTNANSSPFVIAMKTAKIKVLPDIINAALLVFVGSSANTDIYLGSRAIYGLAKDGLAPSLFLRLNKNQVPYNACIFTGLFGSLAYMNVSQLSATIFNYFSSAVSVFGLLTWLNILLSYNGYYRATQVQQVPRDEIAFRMWGQPYISYVTAFFVMVILFFNGYLSFIHGFKYKSFITSYIGILAYVIMIVGFKLVRKTKRVTAATAVIINYVE